MVGGAMGVAAAALLLYVGVGGWVGYFSINGTCGWCVLWLYCDKFQEDSL